MKFKDFRDWGNGSQPETYGSFEILKAQKKPDEGVGRHWNVAQQLQAVARVSDACCIGLKQLTQQEIDDPLVFEQNHRKPEWPLDWKHSFHCGQRLLGDYFRPFLSAAALDDCGDAE